MYAFALLTNLILASAAVAIPTSAERHAARVAARNARTSQPLMPLDGAINAATNVTHEEFSQNWAGAVWSKAAGTFKAVTGTFTVPKATGSGSASASAWVGIDGSSCSNAILQTGVDFNADGSYDSWYEWYPDVAHDFSLDISEGDVITVTVTASSKTAGTAVIENTTTGKKVSKALTSSSALCEQDAEWIVEDFEEGGGLVPFANFGTVTFSDATATTGSGSVSPDGATVIDIKQGSTQLTQTTISGNKVTVKYT
ncbi:acidic protease 1 [Coniophora puteana RWD-64-598 SS2]|uniref:Acidic protease 1 n=1 Tax=Coniophora puteana (strain RWD-64-598) TaxID=741705 RepID=A0A5M3MWI0_CONPW|nr:acidic protease 1 [Coniophora puteana RWD-64-598 SS2]EIW83513.1 acidic protease 1 [Coniophora puteana RWD-64-598 SS2]